MGIRKFSRRPRVAVAPASPTSSRSLEASRRSRWCDRCIPRVVATCTAGHGSPPRWWSQAPIASSTPVATTKTACHKVAHIEYDPNRTARIALLHYADGEKRYIIAPARLQQGDTVEAGPSSDIAGQHLPLWATSRSAPSSTPLSFGPVAGKIARSAGTSVQLVAKEGRALRNCGCRRARFPQRRCAAARPSAKSATPSSRTSIRARPAACAGRAFARPSAVSP